MIWPSPGCIVGDQLRARPHSAARSAGLSSRSQFRKVEPPCPILLNQQVNAEGNEFAAVNREEPGPTLLFIQGAGGADRDDRLHRNLAAADWATELDQIVGLGDKCVGDFAGLRHAHAHFVSSPR